MGKYDTYEPLFSEAHTKMSPHPTLAQYRMNNIVTCLTLTTNTLQILATTLETPFLEAISNTTQSLLKHVQVKFHCVDYDSQP
jgi:hypothetical protein